MFYACSLFLSDVKHIKIHQNTICTVYGANRFGNELTSFPFAVDYFFKIGILNAGDELYYYHIVCMCLTWFPFDFIIS